MSLQTFIEKARAKEQRKIKVKKLEVEGFGEVEFVRPKEEILLDYMEIAQARNGEVEVSDVKRTAKASSEFVYRCCPDIQSKEVREEFGIEEPFDAPLIIFGAIETINVGAELFVAFSGQEVREEVEDAVKN